MNRFVFLGTVLAGLLVSGCANLTGPPVALVNYQPEAFASKDTHTRKFNQPPGVTCEAARRALLSQGYIISEAKADQVRARKLFQPHADRHVELEFRVVCAGEGVDRRVTEAFANGVQDQYGMRKVKSSASVGVGGVGSLSLPVQGENDTMVKIASETVTDHQMYQRLFDLMQRHLDPSASLGDADTAAPDDKKAAARPANDSAATVPLGVSGVPGAPRVMMLVPMPDAVAVPQQATPVAPAIAGSAATPTPTPTPTPTAPAPAPATKGLAVDEITKPAATPTTPVSPDAAASASTGVPASPVPAPASTHAPDTTRVPEPVATPSGPLAD